VWSAVLRRGTPQPSHAAELRALIHEGRVEIVGPIRQELLSGIRSPQEFDRLDRHLRAFPDVPVTTDDYVEAARFFNACRAHGVQGSNTDFLICALAARTGCRIYTTDKDFGRYAAHLPVALHVPRA
jgi:predicted nucleic acid-binding protein